MIPIVFLFYKNTTTFKDYHSYEKVHGKWIKFVGKMNYQSDKSKLQIIGGCVEEKAQQRQKELYPHFYQFLNKPEVLIFQWYSFRILRSGFSWFSWWELVCTTL